MMSASIPLDLASLTKSQWDAAWATDQSWVMSEVYRAHAAAVRQRATHICGADLAHDVTHEVLMRLWRHPGGFDPSRGALRTYLLVLASGVAIDQVRSEARRRGRERRVEFASSLVSHDDITVVEPLLEKETAEYVNHALSTIGPAQRRAIEAVYFEGRTYAETATHTGVAQGTVKSRVRLGLDRLRPAVSSLREDAQKKAKVMRGTRSSNRLAGRRGAFGIGTLIVTFAISSCGADSVSPVDASADVKVQIVTTVAPITSIVASIVGDRADVHGIVPEGTNSHTFEPKPSVAELLADADVMYINGLALEEPTKDLAESNMRDGAAIVELGTLTIPESDYIYDFSFPLEAGKPNPHLWTDPTLARRYAEIVKDDMAARDPENASYYTANYDVFAATIDELDGAMRTAFATIPKRELLTYHDAYAYFARTYDWTVLGAIQISDFEDPTPGEVADLIDQVRASGVPAIFGSEVFPSPVLAQIGREAGVEYVDDLRDDDLPGQPGDDEHSWLGLMRFDYITMTDALGGDSAALRAVVVNSSVVDEATYPQ